MLAGGGGTGWTVGKVIEKIYPGRMPGAETVPGFTNAIYPGWGEMSTK